MCNCNENSKGSGASSGVPAGNAAPAAQSLVPPGVPLAQRISAGGSGEAEASLSPEIIFKPPPFRFCPAMQGGCYSLSFQPSHLVFVNFQGTLRIDRSAPDGGPDNLIASGDLYRFSQIIIDPPPIHPRDEGQAESQSVAAAASAPLPFPIPPFRPPQIPIFARNRYSSYLKVVSVTGPTFVHGAVPCPVTIVAEQFDYTQPASGTFKGSFPASASRAVTLQLTLAGTSQAGGPHYAGRWVVNGVDQGSVNLNWISPFFRRATVEIDTLQGAVRPTPVPNGSGGSEFFDTIYAKHGWQLSVINDQVNVPVPPPPPAIVPTNCWASSDLHNLMTINRNPATNLDAEWHVHLMVVPAKLGCGRGVMYDTIGVPREGCASFCNDGYPSGESANFGTAANQEQRNVARAFLRSATHEITHTFNQIHQEQETAADNSIMTTTPSVADVLGGPSTGAPGVFPDQINLAVNTNVRHHLNHMPDPVIRPGGWPFASWFGAPVLQAADRHEFADSELQLEVAPLANVVLGQPIEVSWKLTNRSGSALLAPNDVSLEGLYASMAVTDPSGATRAFRAAVIRCEHTRIAELAPGESISSSHRVFWSAEGLAFPRPGAYRIGLAVTWSAQGVPVGVTTEADVFVEFPTNAADNAAAGLVLHAQVGKWVALGGHAYHLTEAARRLSALAARTQDNQAPRLLAGFTGLLPDPDRTPPAGQKAPARSPKPSRK